MLSIPTLFIIMAVSLGIAVCIYALIEERLKKEGLLPSRSEQPEATSARRRKRLVKSISSLGDISPIRAENAEIVRGKLARAGMRVDLSTWRGVQIASAGVGVLLAAALLIQSVDINHFVLAALLAGLGISGPQLIIASLIRDRKNKIKASLASTLELLSITVRSGYPLERGLKLIATTSEGPLAEEFRQVDTDINLLGMSLERALRRMQNRCCVDGVSSFSAALIQATKQGASVSRVLDAQARLARSEHYASLQDKVNRLPAKLVVPIFGIMSLIIVIALVPPIYDTVMLFANSYS